MATEIKNIKNHFFLPEYNKEVIVLEDNTILIPFVIGGGHFPLQIVYKTREELIEEHKNDDEKWVNRDNEIFDSIEKHIKEQ